MTDLSDKDYKKLINKTVSWDMDFNYDVLHETDISNRNCKWQKRTNGGGERAILMREKKKISKRERQEMIGKSSRKYSRMKNEWLEEIDG